MTDKQQEIVSNIQHASNQVHQKTMRGDADVIFVSRRVMNEIQDILRDEPLCHFNVVEGSGWVLDASPCDIRALIHMGFGRIEVNGNGQDTSEKRATTTEFYEAAAESNEDINSADEARQEFEELEIPDIEFVVGDKETTVTYDITLENSLFE